MIKEKKAILGLLLISIFSLPWVYGQAESPALQEKSAISVEARLTIEKHGQEEWLVLHAKDAQTYLITGNLREELKNTLLELGTDNLVSVTGNQDGRSNISCQQSSQYEYNKRGEKELKTEAKCIRYYHLAVTQIIFAKKSDEEIPPPQRDTQEERKAQGNRQPQGLTPLIRGEIYAKITSVNLKSAIKTIEVINQNKDSPIKNIALIITPDTQIVKKIGKEEPLALRTGALKTGQKVTVVFSKDEFKTEALFITITKED